MTVLIKCAGWANGLACPHDGEFVESGDHDAYNGQGYFTFTTKVNNAKRFASVKEALEFWQRQSVVKPLRPDGKPNRPLTAMHAELVSLP